VPNNSHHRSDIQGLRAIAVMLVIAGHLFPLSVKGGFVGVDIFFVISGFVITMQMGKLYEANPSTFLRVFYSKRVKRILPAALLVSVASIFATTYLLGPVAGNEAKVDGGWTTIFFGNFHFHETALNYFETGTQQSPLQHYWSLSIEEQFYLIWPVLFLIMAMKAKSLRAKQLILLGITLSSLFTPKNLIFLSLGILLLSSILIMPTMQWPGLLSIPIALATSVLLVNNPRIVQVRLLNNRLLVYVGNLSYLLYLWHWPIFVIIKALSTSFGNIEKLNVLTLTVFLSVITHHFFENPIRFSTTSKPRTTIALGVSAIAVLSSFLFISHQG
jgi:peptidoglycan/LPS O-acetylase OafA/YrhL